MPPISGALTLRRFEMVSPAPSPSPSPFPCAGFQTHRSRSVPPPALASGVARPSDLLYFEHCDVFVARANAKTCSQHSEVYRRRSIGSSLSHRECLSAFFRAVVRSLSSTLSVSAISAINHGGRIVALGGRPVALFCPRGFRVGSVAATRGAHAAISFASGFRACDRRQPRPARALASSAARTTELVRYAQDGMHQGQPRSGASM